MSAFKVIVKQLGNHKNQKSALTAFLLLRENYIGCNLAPTLKLICTKNILSMDMFSDEKMASASI